MTSEKLLRIGIVQTDIYWEDIGSNLASLEEKLAGLRGSIDIIVLPEMFATGFSPRAFHIAEGMNGQIHKWMKLIAKQTGAVLVGSVLVKEAEKYYNRLFWIEPTGNTQTYDKKHLFSYAGEDKWLTAGKKRQVFSWKGWQIRPMICYDLRFPLWSWQEKTQITDILIYVASWPDQRIGAWRALLKARAIENQSYVVGVNHVGIDKNGNRYSGFSSVHSFNGEVLKEIEEEEGIQIVVIDKEELEAYRRQYSFFTDGIE